MASSKQGINVKEVKRELESVLNENQVVLHNSFTVTAGTLGEIARELSQVNIINKAVKKAPTYDAIIDSFVNGMKLRNEMSGVEEHCKKFLKALSNVGGSVADAAVMIEAEWIKVVKVKYGVDLKLTLSGHDEYPSTREQSSETAVRQRKGKIETIQEFFQPQPPQEPNEGGTCKLLYFIGGGLGAGVLLLIIFGCYVGYIPIPGFTNPVNRAHDKVIKMDAAPETNDFNEPDTPKGTKHRVKRGEQSLYITDLADIKQSLKNSNFDVSTWRDLCLNLGLNEGTLNTIEKDKSDSNERFTTCLHKWLNRVDQVDSKGGATKSSLVRTLEDIGQKPVAEAIDSIIFTEKSRKG